MKVVLDADVLLALLRPARAVPPRDPATGEPVPAWRARLAELVARLDEERSSVVVPAPALAALLVRAGRATDALLREVEARRAFGVQAFDLRAAVEAAASARESPGADGAAADYARQIVAIARVSGAGRVYSGDAGVLALGRARGLEAVASWELPLPLQGRLELGEAGP